MNPPTDENEGKQPVSPSDARAMSAAFLKMPLNEKLRVASELGLREDKDTDFTDVDFCKAVFQRATKEGKVYALRAALLPNRTFESSLPPASETATPECDEFGRQPMEYIEGKAPSQICAIGWERFARSLELRLTAATREMEEAKKEIERRRVGRIEFHDETMAEVESLTDQLGEARAQLAEINGMCENQDGVGTVAQCIGRKIVRLHAERDAATVRAEAGIELNGKAISREQQARSDLLLARQQGEEMRGTLEKAEARLRFLISLKVSVPYKFQAGKPPRYLPVTIEAIDAARLATPSPQGEKKP